MGKLGVSPHVKARELRTRPVDAFAGEVLKAMGSVKDWQGRPMPRCAGDAEAVQICGRRQRHREGSARRLTRTDATAMDDG